MVYHNIMYHLHESGICELVFAIPWEESWAITHYLFANSATSTTQLRHACKYLIHFWEVNNNL